MPDYYDIRPLHQLIRHDPDRPKKELRVTVAELPKPDKPHLPRIAVVQVGDASVSIDHQMSPKHLLIQLLRRYPVPVFINGEELERHPVHADPSVTTWVPAPEGSDHYGEMVTIGHTPASVVTEFLINGVTYRPDIKHWDSFADDLHIPDEENANRLYTPTRTYRVRPSISINLNKEETERLTLMAHNSMPSCDFDDHTATIVANMAADQRRRGLELIGYAGTTEQLRQLPYQTTWNQQIVVPKPGVTPATIEFNPHSNLPPNTLFGSFFIYRPRNPAQHAVAEHLLTHPELGILPVIPGSRDQTDLANIHIDHVAITYSSSSHAKPDPTDLTPADIINVHTILTQTDGTEHPLTIDADAYFLGKVPNEYPVVTTGYAGTTEDLSQRIFDAYYVPDYKGRGDEDNDQADQYRARARYLAVTLLRDQHTALRDQLTQLWNSFVPATPIPDHFDLAAEMADIIRNSPTPPA